MNAAVIVNATASSAIDIKYSLEVPIITHIDQDRVLMFCAFSVSVQLL
jgi:hypothetical protein